MLHVPLLNRTGLKKKMIVAISDKFYLLHTCDSNLPYSSWATGQGSTTKYNQKQPQICKKKKLSNIQKPLGAICYDLLSDYTKVELFGYNTRGYVCLQQNKNNFFFGTALSDLNPSKHVGWLEDGCAQEMPSQFDRVRTLLPVRIAKILLRQ